MFDKNDKRSLYELIDLYLSGSITISIFSNEFHNSYNLEIDDNDFNQVEKQAFSELFKIEGRFSESEEDHRKYPKMYFTKEELHQKIVETKEKLKRMKHILFVGDTKSEDDSFYAYISTVTTKEELFKELSQKLHFPDYFDFNWKALSDCLGTLEWIDTTNVILLHSALNLKDEDFGIYLEILINSVDSWSHLDIHKLEIRFSKEQENLILRLLEKIKDPQIQGIK